MADTVAPWLQAARAGCHATIISCLLNKSRTKKPKFYGNLSKSVLERKVGRIGH